MLEKKLKWITKKISAENIILEVMRHFVLGETIKLQNILMLHLKITTVMDKNGEIPPKHLIKIQRRNINK